ncbi:MAG: hypothetical protein ACI94Y_001597 [Maribacter sp.]|jgi:hypothetical protein
MFYEYKKGCCTSVQHPFLFKTKPIDYLVIDFAACLQSKVSIPSKKPIHIQNNQIQRTFVAYGST